MKKTIITLTALVAAFSGAASAAITTGPTYGGNFWISDFDFDFELTDALVADMTNNGTTYTLAAYWGGNPNDWAGANMFTLSNTADGITLTAGRGALNESDATATTVTFKNWNQSVVVYSGLTTGKYSVDTTGASGDNGQKVSLLQDGVILASDKAYNGNMNGDDSTPQSYFNTSFAVQSVQPGEGGSDNIPEPTTATLSLLALAGLAARRRRK